MRRFKVTNAFTTEVRVIDVLESLLMWGRRKGAVRPSADISVGRASAARSLTKDDDEVG